MKPKSLAAAKTTWSRAVADRAVKGDAGRRRRRGRRLGFRKVSVVVPRGRASGCADGEVVAPARSLPRVLGGADVLELINTVERTIRPIKPGHENHLFAGSDGGAESSNSPPECRATTPHRSRRSTIITRQLPVACWHQTIGDPTPAFPTGRARGLRAHGAGSTPTPSSTPRPLCSATQPVGQQPAANRYKSARDRPKCSVSQIKLQGAALWAA